MYVCMYVCIEMLEKYPPIEPRSGYSSTGNDEPQEFVKASYKEKYISRENPRL